MAESPLLTISEASDLLRLRPSTIRSWILHHRIPYVKLSRRVFIRKADAEALITAGIVPARPARVHAAKTVSDSVPRPE